MFRGISISTIIIILFIVLMLFGTKRLRTIGDDLAAALKSFRKGLQDSDEKDTNKTP